MSANSKIEWCEATWNFLAGCSLVSPGCAKCYAMRAAHRLAAMGQAKYAGTTKKVNGLPVWTGLVNVDEPTLTLPLRTRKPTVWFVNSMSDLFHEAVPDEVIDRAFAVMTMCRRHTFQILTKRAERMAAWVAGADGPVREGGWPLPNVWLGVSCEDQQRADERIPHLLRTPAAVRFVSYEPALGPVDIGASLALAAKSTIPSQWRTAWRGYIDWVIVGGESGPGARPCHVEWVRSVVRQCKAAGVACFVKQFGAVPLWNGVQGGHGDGPSDVWPKDVKRTNFAGNWRVLLKSPKGGDPAEWPEDLRVREYPEVRK